MNDPAVAPSAPVSPAPLPDEVGTSLLHFSGGTTSFIPLPPTQVVHELERARREGFDYVWLQPNDRVHNSIAVDPHTVVAVFRGAH
jgi:hypothetical protein